MTENRVCSVMQELSQAEAVRALTEQADLSRPFAILALLNGKPLCGFEFMADQSAVAELMDVVKEFAARGLTGGTAYGEYLGDPVLISELDAEAGFVFNALLTGNWFVFDAPDDGYLSLFEKMWQQPEGISYQAAFCLKGQENWHFEEESDPVIIYTGTAEDAVAGL